MVKKLLHTRYRVKDLEKTISFYRDVLGLKELRRQKSGRGSQLVFLKAPGSEEGIEICKFDESGPPVFRPVRFGRRKRLPQKIKRMPMFLPVRFGRRTRRNRVILARAERDQSPKRKSQPRRRPSTLLTEFQRPARPRSSWWMRTRAKHCTKKTLTRYELRLAPKNC